MKKILFCLGVLSFMNVLPTGDSCLWAFLSCSSTIMDTTPRLVGCCIRPFVSCWKSQRTQTYIKCGICLCDFSLYCCGCKKGKNVKIPRAPFGVTWKEVRVKENGGYHTESDGWSSGDEED